ncbi:hypothetical protein V1506DRAFT_188766 [Lipomyces tetrasporus]
MFTQTIKSRSTINWHCAIGRTSYFPGNRLGHRTSNVAESFNSWILEARSLPDHAMMERIRLQLMLLRTERLKDIQKLRKDGKRITETAAKVLAKSVTLAREYIVIPANRDEYEVRTQGGESFAVYLVSCSCPCRRWDHCGVPCSHAVAAISFAGLDIIDFVEDHFKVDAFERTYAQGIHAMSTVNVTNADTLPKVGSLRTRSHAVDVTNSWDIMRRHAQSRWGRMTGPVWPAVVM